MRSNFLPIKYYTWAATAVAGAGALYKIGSGIVQKSKAKKEARELEANRPKFGESPYYKQQLSLAQSELANGGGRAEEVEKEQGDQDLSSSLSALTKMGGTPNDVASVFAANEQGRARYALIRQNLRLNQISNLSKAQENVEEDRQRAFGYNINAPYKDAAAANAAAAVSAQTSISSGIDTLGSAVASGVSTAGGKAQLDGYFKKQNGDLDNIFSKYFTQNSGMSESEIDTGLTNMFKESQAADYLATPTN